jgi:isopenicillin N synthase-like dioxygenase
MISSRQVLLFVLRELPLLTSTPKQNLPGWRAAWDEAFADAERFFALPQAEKDTIHITKSRHLRGYSGVGSETTQGKSDLREQIDLG